MLANRHRGLVRIHGAALLLGVAVFFWLYAEFIMRYVPVVKLSREVNLLQYFLCVVIGLLAGAERIRGVESRLTRLGGAEAAGLATTQVGLMALAVFAMMFATQDRSISRLFLGSFLAWTWLGLFFLHGWLPRRLAGFLYGSGARIPTLFIGRAETLPMLDDWLKQRMHLGVLPAGFLTLDELATPARSSAAPFMGAVDKLPRVLAEKAIAQVILLEVPANPLIARQIVEQCQAQGCRLLVHHLVEEVLGHPVVSSDEGGHHFFTLHDEPLEDPLNRALKRLFDVLVALPVVVCLLPPLMLVVWVVQRFQSPGPLFHVRARSGEGRTEFPMLKFRSMELAPADPRAEGRQARLGDDRIYPFARFLRRHSLDEFPQFWNVLIGEMSVVGPRPVMPVLDEEFERQVRSYRSKHWVKPGITGLAQSEGYRGEIQTPEQLHERIRLDLYYIAHWSMWLDVQITLKTLRQVFLPPKSAY
ncbi:UDP-glucose:undecaprenyl-phosphate glucose-1-phosphate transferase [Lacunisphaera limnophila]|uniref:UDP-glucose:undecaprenyl-phosphate glucose-1-phosphate transferase n=1 Tax=Lacunisphaera limnophila TaxID=1838286 RepID=A0A1D8AXD3_9BACT|nr:exopolysaccharide biosynthesis polyprenyl glycosylphosphotransferase [Lacunisphaera limnophila]AOS45549.1 UDP-glucose:undecaprenyl-phosphate glucose-1-phosphate transferase [Lacunisphaera limnophila]